jgi:hypothetical protein
MAASPDSEPFNTALADGLKEALNPSDDGQGSARREVKDLATGALQMLARNPAAVVAVIALFVCFIFRKPSS